MPRLINGKKYYTTSEACLLAGTSRNTFLRWVREGQFSDVPYRDRRGWRLFTDKELIKLKNEVNKIYGD
jgi:predicted site-specific integrase-resolvase